MRVIPPEQGQEYILEFESAVEYQAFFDQAQEKGHFDLHISNLSRQPIFRARCLGSPRSRKITPEGVKQQEGGVYRIDLPHVGPAAPKAAEGNPQPATPPAQAAESFVGSDRVYDRIKALTMNEKVALALRADLMERRVLMQENNLKINEFLLRNPRLTDQEVVWFARNPALPMQTLLAIAQHSSWMKNVLIRSAIFMNPRTPAPKVLEMIPLASEADLVRLHNASEIRMDIKAAVVREVRKRGINPRRAVD